MTPAPALADSRLISGSGDVRKRSVGTSPVFRKQQKPTNLSYLIRMRTIHASAIIAVGLLLGSQLNAGIVPNGANVQPSYYNGGNPNFGWSLMNQNGKIATLRIEIEPDKVSQAKSWISQARSNGKTVIATYHKASVLGSDSTTELNNAANWWKNNYSTLSASGSFTVNLMNEWGSHNISASSFASAYNTAISTVRQKYSGRIIIDCAGWGQETTRMIDSIKGTSGTKINDSNISPSVHIYPGDWNQGGNHWLSNADLDALNGAGRSCIAGEFGSGGSGSANWSALVDHAKALGWSVLGWAWNGDGGSMNMVTPSWASNGGATSFSKSSYFSTVYNKL
jgi:mannan endo-1,4-beta-mannosidase